MPLTLPLPGLHGLPLFAAFLVVHALCDFPLQGDFLARLKNRHTAPVGGLAWLAGLGAHAAIQAGGVWALTGSGTLATIEFALHAAIDAAKSEGAFSFTTDQFLHIACKLVYTLVLF